MANFYYYFLEVKRGPIASTQVKELAAKGIITPDTVIEDEAGKKYKGARVRGLEFPAKPAVTIPKFPLAAVKTEHTPEEVFNIGVRYSEEEKHNEAVEWFRHAAERGYTKAQFNLGVCYANGDGVEKNKVEAVKWYRKAAEQGFANAQIVLGHCYDKGAGIEKNEVEAVKWYRKAAEQGNATAQAKLGVCYANGDGVEKNRVEAVKWYRQAAEQGNAIAQTALGLCYANGDGVEKNMAVAVNWYRKAAEQGHALAKEVLEELENEQKRQEEHKREAETFIKSVLAIQHRRKIYRRRPEELSPAQIMHMQIMEPGMEEAGIRRLYELGFTQAQLRQFGIEC